MVTGPEEYRGYEKFEGIVPSLTVTVISYDVNSEINKRNDLIIGYMTDLDILEAWDEGFTPPPIPKKKEMKIPLLQAMAPFALAMAAPYMLKAFGLDKQFKGILPKGYKLT